jgi:hypothetical protein
VLTFARGANVVCVVNLSDAAVVLPAHGSVLMASGPVDGNRLPPDTAAWLSPGRAPSHSQAWSVSYPARRNSPAGRITGSTGGRANSRTVS